MSYRACMSFILLLANSPYLLRFAYFVVACLLGYLPQIATAQPSIALQSHINTIVADFAQHSEDAALQLPYNLCVGIIDQNYQYQYYYPNAQVPDSAALFRIGAVSKTFTAALLQAAILAQQVNLDDTVAQYLPDSVRRANPYLNTITLRHLATHTAGLPKDPYNLADTYTDPQNPYEPYGIADLYRFLQFFRPDQSGAGKKRAKRRPNTAPYTFNYSHTGSIVLAHCLERATGQPYAALLQTYIAQPLGLRYTCLSPPPNTPPIGGHFFNNAPHSPISYGEVMGAEGIYSNLSDMLRYVAAHLSAPPHTTFSFVHRPSAATNTKHVSAAGGWFLYQRNAKSPAVLTHSGRTGGYACYVAFEPKRKVGIVLLANADRHIDELGIAILDFLLR